MKLIRLICIAILAGAAAVGSSQTKMADTKPPFSIVHLDAVPSAELRKNALQVELARMKFNRPWRFVIVHTPDAWKKIQVMYKKTGKTSPTAYTSLTMQTTYLNGVTLDLDPVRRSRTIDHELAHIAKPEDSEKAVQAIGHRLATGAAILSGNEIPASAKDALSKKK